MKMSFVLFAIMSGAGQIFAVDSSVGFSSIKMKMPKAEPQIISVSRFVLESRQELQATCPSNGKIFAATCDAVSAATDDQFFSFNKVMTIVDTTTEIPTAKCTAVMVRPDEIKKISMSVKCEGEPQFTSAAN